MKHGDVYEIATENPDSHPLPSFQRLDMRYALDRATASLTSRGLLKTIFRGDPPAGCSEAEGEIVISADWFHLLLHAWEEGVLDDTAAEMLCSAGEVVAETGSQSLRLMMGQVRVESIRGVLIRNRYGIDNSLRMKVGPVDHARLVLRL